MNLDKAENAMGSMEQEDDQKKRGSWQDNSKMNIPKTFAAMARFNAAVMGTGDRMWFADMLYAMESLVPYVGNIDRVQEDCDVLTLTLAKHGKVNLKEFRSVMFASLRSLLPTAWSTEHENAWAWFWSIVERKVEDNSELIARNHQCLRTFLARLDEAKLASFKLQVFDTFFASCEESQIYLRAANKRLVYIMGRVLTIMSEIYTKSHQAVIKLSALGLMHPLYRLSCNPSENTARMSLCMMASGGHWTSLAGSSSAPWRKAPRQ